MKSCTDDALNHSENVVLKFAVVLVDETNSQMIGSRK